MIECKVGEISSLLTHSHFLTAPSQKHKPLRKCAGPGILAPNPQPLPSFGRRVKVLFDGKKRYPGVIIGQDNSCKCITRFEDGTEDTVSDPDACR